MLKALCQNRKRMIDLKIENMTKTLTQEEKLIRKAKSEYQRKYRENNKEKVATYNKKYRENNQEKIKEINKRYWLGKAEEMYSE